VNELTAILEPKRRTGARHLPYTLVERGDEFECYRARRGGPSLVAKGSLDQLNKARLPRKLREQPIEYRLDGSRVFTKILHFPAASREYLDAIVKHQLDRATPWAADRVAFDYAIADDEGTPEGQIAVRLVATSRDVFDRSMSRLTAARIKVAVVGTSEDPVDHPSTVNLLQSDRTERRAALRRKVSMGLVAFLLISASLGALSGWRLFALQTQAAELQSETDAIRARIESALSGTEFAASRGRLVASKRDAVPMVVLIEHLSAVIPENTYLTELSVENGEVQIAGLTSDAPALIGILESADLLANVRFAAPTLRDEGAARDRFVIAAAILPAAPGD
jgi:general secretion pathway protein L